ncbi:MAG: hypothetical protein HY962_11040 [Ignavibacteriae bacterium]|nr:hypothetical protein [Ignavibacteriota bacterium]
MHRSLHFLLLCPILFAACAGPAALGPTNEYIMYPPPPQVARVQYLTSFAEDRRFACRDAGGVLSTILGDDAGIHLIRPYGLATHNGKLYVCDSRVHGLVVGDFAKGTLSAFQPRGQGQLRVPINCAVDSSGRVYVADTDRKQVVIFTPELDYINAIGDGKDSKPVDVKCTSGGVWILDMLRHQVQVFPHGGGPMVRSFPDTTDPKAPSYLFSPTNFAIWSDRVYVSDIGDQKIKVFDLEGTYITSIGSHGNQLGQFVRPKGVDVDRDGNLYAVDAAFENVQIFDKEGRLLLFFGGPYHGPGDLNMPVKVLIDYEHVDHFKKYVAPGLVLKYLIFVTNQWGSDLVNVYGFVGP